MVSKKKRRLTMRRKRTLDVGTIIDYKRPDILKRFVTDRGKIIPRRISGATAKQQRLICVAVKRARFLALLPCSVAHRHERGFAGEILAAATSSHHHGGGGMHGSSRPPMRDMPPRDHHGGGHSEGGGGHQGGGHHTGSGGGQSSHGSSHSDEG